MNQKIVWTDDVLNFIIKYVQATPYVWNYSHPHYKNQRRKSKFWSDLTKKINSYWGFRSQNPSLTRDVLSRKWNNMKSYYVSERHRLRCENINDPDPDTVVWKFMPAMSFLNVRGLNESTAKKDTKTGSSFSNDKSPSDESNDPFEERYELSLDPLAAAKIKGDAKVEVNSRRLLLLEETSDHNNDKSYLTDDVEDNDCEECIAPIQEQIVECAKPLVPPTIRKMNNSFFHFAMIIAQDLDQLDENLKIDAKLEIMQIVAKYKKEHLRVKRNIVIVKSEPT